MRPLVLCLLGPTASGKTPLAIELAKHFPVEMISVDSAMVYRGLDIGTAKPTREILQSVPHHLINILEPTEIYSAGQFRQDALCAIDSIVKRGKIPLLVGGTMLYFRVLQQGLATLPQADKNLRAQIQERAQQLGLKALHAELAKVDSEAASRINENDSQRIQRALEVYQLTGKTISAWQKENTTPLANYRVCNFAPTPARDRLHKQIEQRFLQMLEWGFVDEVQRLRARYDLTLDLPAMRAVGYRQIWEYLEGQLSYAEMTEKAMTATRQLAKRQMTWLRSWPDLTCFPSAGDQVFRFLEEMIGRSRFPYQVRDKLFSGKKRR